MSLSLSSVGLPRARGFQCAGPSGVQSTNGRPARAAASASVRAKAGDPLRSRATTGCPRSMRSLSRVSRVVDLPEPVAPRMSAWAASCCSPRTSGRPDRWLLQPHAGTGERHCAPAPFGDTADEADRRAGRPAPCPGPARPTVPARRGARPERGGSRRGDDCGRGSGSPLEPSLGGDAARNAAAAGSGRTRAGARSPAGGSVAPPSRTGWTVTSSESPSRRAVAAMAPPTVRCSVR